MRARILVVVLLFATSCGEGGDAVESGGVAGECHADPDYHCGPQDCSSLENNATPRWKCGDDTLFNREGCMRPRCSMDDSFFCPDGTSCSIKESMPSVIECFEVDDECECTVSGDLDPNTGVCI